MAELLKNWLLDPAALVFFTSGLAIVLLLFFGRSRGRRGRGRIRWLPVLFFGGIWLLVCLVTGAPSIVNPLLTVLEEQYPASTQCESGSHLVALGGGVDSRVKTADEFERMSTSTLARTSAALRIGLAEPKLVLISSGGALKTVSEADLMGNYWNALGIDNTRVLREANASNTRENALKVAELLESQAVEGDVRLVTSALHMPRALNAFRAVLEPKGFTVCPVSVNQEALPNIPLWASVPQTTAVVKFNKWLHEIVALAAYKAKGWI